MNHNDSPHGEREWDMEMDMEKEPAPEPGSASGLSGGYLLALSLMSTLVYVLISWILFHFVHGSGFGHAFTQGSTLTVQLLVGGTAGVLAAASVRFSAEREPVSGVLRDYYLVRILEQTRFSAFDRIQLSLFAGAGEELLFRGALQPLLGVWLTSAIFVGIHGYFKFRTAGHWLFGTLMFGLSVMLGLLFDYTGLVSAMVAHAVYDLVMLRWVSGSQRDSRDRQQAV